MSNESFHRTGELIETVMEGLSTDGRAVVRVGKTAHFVAGVLPGDRVQLELIPDTNPPAGRVVRILEPSPYRVHHPCPEAAACSGSVWGSLAYEEQLRHKRELVLRTLRKIAGEQEVLPTVASPQTWHYRNRLSLSVWSAGGRMQIGFRTEPRSQAGIAIRTCALADESLLPCLHTLIAAAGKTEADRMARLPRRIQIHTTARGPGLLLVFAGRAGETDAQTWRRLLTNVPVRGGMWLASGNAAGIVEASAPLVASDHALPMQTQWRGHTVDVHPATFCQANAAAADLVHERLHRWGSEEKITHVWDLYGGYGALGLAAARGCPVSVFEMTRASRGTFLSLAAHAGGPHVEFVAGDLARTLPRAAERITDGDLVILDPPRSGAHPRVLVEIAGSRVRRVAYLSCNPARLGRDLVQLFAAGFRAEEIQPYDFFPQTPRIEVLCLLRR